jgi:formylglycine-generating enzyme required for sulfatase activity
LKTTAVRAAVAQRPAVAKAASAKLPAQFANGVGAPMVLIPAGEFIMGSDAEDAAPNERPLTPVSLGAFYMARFPVTNAEYERFDPAHRQKR